MRTKKRVNELEYDLALAVGRISKLEWAFAEMFPKPKRKYVKSGKYTKEAKMAKGAQKVWLDDSAKHLTHKKHSRVWTDEQRMEQSRKLKASWAERKQVV